MKTSLPLDVRGLYDWFIVQLRASPLRRIATFAVLAYALLGRRWTDQQRIELHETRCHGSSLLERQRFAALPLVQAHELA